MHLFFSFLFFSYFILFLFNSQTASLQVFGKIVNICAFDESWSISYTCLKLIVLHSYDMRISY